MGLVRYRWWEGAIIVELVLLDQPTAILAVIPGSDRPRRRYTETAGQRQCWRAGRF
jgi:hypothetical protein